MQLQQPVADSRAASDQPHAFRRVLVGIDDSEPSGWAVGVGAALAKRIGAAVTLLHVIDLAKGFSPELEIMDERLLSQMRHKAAELLERRQRSLPAGLDVTREIREGSPPTELVAAAQEAQADLIVIGTHARGAVARFLLGSTAEAVVRRAHCPVVTISHAPAFVRQGV